MMRFDAYKASLPGGIDAVQVIDFLAAANPLGAVAEGRPRFGYQACATLRDENGDRWVDVLHGGTNGVLIEVSGECTPDVVHLVRNTWPAHAVTRADVCQDIIEEERGVFGRIAPRLDRLVQDHGRVKAKGIIPRVRPEDGATYTIGSRSSETYFRVYQKPEQLLAEGLGDHSLRVFFDKWVRVELEAKPQKDNRLRAATFSPQDFFGLSRIARSVCVQILDEAIDKTSVINYKELTTKERQRRALVRQYGNVLEALREEVGSWAELGLSIRDLIEAERERR